MPRSREGHSGEGDHLQPRRPKSDENRKKAPNEGWLVIGTFLQIDLHPNLNQPQIRTGTLLNH